MKKDVKLVDLLDVDDFKGSPVWSFVNDDEAGELLVKPVKKLPTKGLDGKIVGTKIKLGNNTEVWATLANIDVTNPRRSKHLLTVSVERAGKWFHLARYHDFDYTERGPEALAKFLSLPVDQVFPLSFDLRPYAQGDIGALVGVVPKVPDERLSRSDIIELAVP